MSLVIYKNHKKVVETPSRELIAKKFKLSLHLDKYFLQYFNEEFNEFVDCEWDQIPKGCRRLKICEEYNSYCEIPSRSYNCSPTPVNFRENPPIKSYNWTSPRSNVCPDTSNHTELNEHEIFPEIVENDEIVDNDEIESKVSVIDPQLLVEKYSHFNSSDKNTSQEYDGINLENDSNDSPSQQFDFDRDEFSSMDNSGCNYTIELPYINPQSRLGKALQKNELLSKRNKHEFLSKIHQSFAEKGVFSLGHRYNELVSLVLTKYPNLCNGLPPAIAKRLWKKSFYAKFCNARRRSDFDGISPLVNPLNQNDSPRTQPLTKLWTLCVKNYRLSSDAEQHNIPINSFKKWMVVESAKVDRNHELLNERMNSTFYHRRNLLFDVNDNGDKYSVSDIINQYPCLSMEFHALQEVRRLFEKDHSKTFLQRLDKFSSYLENKVIQSRTKYRNQIVSIEGFGMCKSQECLYKLAGFIACLNSENPLDVIGNEINEIRQPFLHIDDGVNLMVDGAAFIRNVSPYSAVYLWLSSFFLFGLEPSNQIRRTIETLQYIIFNVPGKPNLNAMECRIYSWWNEAQ